MNNTSAYANVLLTSAKLATPKAVPAGASAQRDHAVADARGEFQQTLSRAQKNAQAVSQKHMDSQSLSRRQNAARQQDDKASNLAATKQASAAMQQDAQQAAQKIKDNNAERTATADQPRKSSTPQAPAASQSARANRKSNSDERSADEIKSALTTAEAPLGAEAKPSDPEQASSAACTDLDPLSLAILGASVAPNMALASADGNLVSAEPELSVGVVSAPLEAVEQAQVAVPTEPALAQALGTPAIALNAPLVEGADAAAQTLAIDETAANRVPPMKTPPQAATTETTSEPASDLSDGLAAGKAPAAAPSTTASSAVPSAEPVSQSDVSAVQLQMQAAKSTFEKTLQPLVAPEAGMDDSLVPSASTSSTNAALDTVQRLSDSATPAARSFVVQTAVPVPVGQPQWSQAVGDKVLWLAAQNVSSAEINLHPKDLGPLQVKVSVNQEQTTVSFSSQHVAVREVLDQNINRLRDMFSEQGLNLVNVDVSDKSFSRQQGDTQDQKGQRGLQGAAPEEETPIAMSNIMQQRLVDHYA